VESVCCHTDIDFLFLRKKKERRRRKSEHNVQNKQRLYTFISSTVFEEDSGCCIWIGDAGLLERFFYAFEFFDGPTWF
jgi:hypothetical protein